MKTDVSQSRRTTLLRRALATLLVASLVACGGSGSGSGSLPATDPTAGIATFIDSKVEGLSYRSFSYNGVTDKNGNFPYAPGEQVAFSVGDLVLGSVVPVGDKVTPLDLVPDAKSATDERVTRILRILQTLDADDDPENGIKISPLAIDYASSQGVPVQVGARSTSDAMVESRLYTTKFTRSKEQAQAHFEAHKDDKSNGSMGVSKSKKKSSNGSGTTTQPANTNGRLLASNCYQCHGTMGTGGFDKIRGSDASELLDYLTKRASDDIMAAHAQGYTRAQLDAIIAYLKQ